MASGVLPRASYAASKDLCSTMGAGQVPLVHLDGPGRMISAVWNWCIRYLHKD